MRTTLLKEGNCACALCQCTCGKKKHITQTFLWHQRVTLSLISVQFYPVHKPLICTNAKTFSHTWLYLPLQKLTAKGCGLFLFVCLFYHFTFYILGWRTGNFAFHEQIFCVKTCMCCYECLNAKHVILWGLTARSDCHCWLQATWPGPSTLTTYTHGN